VEKQEGKLRLVDNRVHSFEWKNPGALRKTPGYPLFYNHVYAIFADAFDEYIWNEDWKVGNGGTVSGQELPTGKTETDYHIEACGTVTTAAGSFENCITVWVNWKNVLGGWAYRGGKMEYTFAPSVGLVKAVHHYENDTKEAVYELTSYTGTGEGYFPAEDGLFRRYEAIGLTEGYVGSAEYTFVRDEKGDLFLLGDATGVREFPRETEAEQK
jgi:hypothetical protein